MRVLGVQVPPLAFLSGDRGGCLLLWVGQMMSDLSRSRRSGSGYVVLKAPFVASNMISTMVGSAWAG